MIKINDKRITISVFRSNKYIYAQALDDGKIIASFSSLNLKEGTVKNKKDQAKIVGMELAKKLKAKKVSKGVVNKNKYAYLGRVKALTEGLREGGLEI